MNVRRVRSWCAGVLVALAPAVAAAQTPMAADGSPPGGAGSAATTTTTTTTTAPAAGTSREAPQPTSGGTPSSPLAIHVGDADLLIGGFMDATAVSRNVYTGNGLGTAFGGNPFTNAPQGNINETRLSTQNSRLTLQATSKVATGNVKGYLEADFLGNAPNGLNVTSNSNTLRMRLYWVQFTQGKFEFLGGQSWSLMTPNRNGLSPMPGDIFFSQNVDTNYQMGLTWARAAQFRFVAHPSKTVTAGVSLENPEQYVGSAVVLPAAFPTFEVDQGGVATNVPNTYPDIIGKIAFDPKTGKTHQHIDAAVLVRGYKTFDQTTATSSTQTGTGGEIGAVLEPVPNFRIVGTAFFSSGGGRYIANTNVPDFIVDGNGSISLVKSRSFIVGPEIGIGSKTVLFGYYSETHADQMLGTDAGKVIGFGTPGSAASNRKITEPTVGIVQTFFRDPKIGGMQLMVQYSRVERTPFSVPSGTPSSARMNMVYVNVRYVLP